MPYIAITLYSLIVEGRIIKVIANTLCADPSLLPRSHRPTRYTSPTFSTIYTTGIRQN